MSNCSYGCMIVTVFDIYVLVTTPDLSGGHSIIYSTTCTGSTTSLDCNLSNLTIISLFLY